MAGIIAAYPVIVIEVFAITGATVSFSKAAQYLKVVTMRKGKFVITSVFSIPFEPQGTSKAGASPDEQLGPTHVEKVMRYPSVTEPLRTKVEVVFASIVRLSDICACSSSGVGSVPVQDTPQTYRTTDGFRAKVVKDEEADLDCGIVEFVEYATVT